MIVANDPPPDERTPIGDLEKPRPRTAVIARVNVHEAVFVTVWGFDGEVEPELIGAADARKDLELVTRAGTEARLWTFPARGAVEMEEW